MAPAVLWWGNIRFYMLRRCMQRLQGGSKNRRYIACYMRSKGRQIGRLERHSGLGISDLNRLGISDFLCLCPLFLPERQYWLISKYTYIYFPSIL
jgi:hypothetical protein